MIHILPSSIAFIGLLIASYTDIRTREVPDWLNYSLVAFGLSINLLLTVIFWDYKYIAASLLGFTAFFILALIMFYAGQWGGGDSKMLMGLGALLGLNIWSNEFPILASFLFNVLIFGAIYGLLWSFLLAYKHRKKFLKEIKKVNKLKKVRMSKIYLLLFFVIVFIVFLFNKNFMTMYLLFLTFMIILILYLWIFIKVIEKACMLKYVKPSQLTEGDWIAKVIKHKGKYITGPKDLGIEKKQIETLKKLKIKKVLIKEGIPFVPSFLLAFTVTVVFGNVLFLIL